MTAPTLDLPFEALTKEQWRTQVEKELKGKSFDDYLLWTNEAGIELESWQQNLPKTVASIPPLKEAWKVLEPVYSVDATSANQVALDALNKGAEAIWFQKSFRGAAAEVAIRGIDTNIAPTFIHRETHADPFEELLKNGKPQEFNGTTAFIINGRRFRERGAHEVLEVALLINQAIEIGDRFGYNSEIIFQTSHGTNYLSEISKLRALRWLWCSILQKKGIENQAKVMSLNLTNGYAQNDEHTNILRATASALSAVIGGANFVMIQPWDSHWKSPNDFSSRISRNIQLLLKEEGRLDKNVNPADGSYFIENLTTEMANKAWEIVRTIEGEGGFSSFATSKKLYSLIEQSGNRLIKAYANNKPLLGVNKYEPENQKDEKPPHASNYALLPPYLHIPHLLKGIK